MKSYVHGKLRDPLAAAAEPAALRLCFDVLRTMVLEHRTHLGKDALQLGHAGRVQQTRWGAM
jgi:hypothetical protein